MPWCPNCKLEYVAGKKICPDCNAELVESLEATVESIPDEISYAAVMGSSLEDIEHSENMQELHQALMENIKQAQLAPKYQSIKTSYEENRSAAVVLTLFGILGLVVLLLNYLGVFNIPMSGFSLTLTYVVMGCLFFVFLASGVLSAIKAKKFKPLAKQEAHDIEKAVKFLKMSLETPEYKQLLAEGSEVSYLTVYEKASLDLKLFLTGSPEGFATYVCDNYLSDLIDEN